jgi:predicted nucleic acid-binding protein
VSLIFWDTNLFIYLIEDHVEFGPRVKGIRSLMFRRQDRLCTSALALGEMLTGPLIRNDESLLDRYKGLLRPPLVEILPFGREATDHYARIRTDPGISRADAIQLACAAAAGVDLFLTNDAHLNGRHVPGIQFITGLENCPL